MADRAEVLLQLHSEERLEARQVEDQRATLTNIIILALGAGLALVADRGFGRSWLPVTIAMLVLGGFGAVATRKYFERWFRHSTRAYAYRQQLFSLYPEIPEDLEPFHRDLLRARSYRYEKESDERFRFTKGVKLHWIWVTFHITVAAIGLILTVLVLAG